MAFRAWSIGFALAIAACARDGGQSGTDQSDLGRTDAGKNSQPPLTTTADAAPANSEAAADEEPAAEVESGSPSSDRADAMTAAPPQQDAEVISPMETEAGPSGLGFDCAEAVGLDPAGTPSAPSEAGVEAINDALQISMSDTHTCIVRRSGHVSCWGQGYNGQLGDGNGSDSATPVDVVGLTDAVQVVASAWNTCALRREGIVACWGDNADYATGNTLPGEAEGWFAKTPVPVCGVSGVVALATNMEAYTCAVLDTGTLSCWGSDDGLFGGLPNTPTPAEATSDVRTVSVGRATCILRTADVECWGLATEVGFISEDPDLPTAVTGFGNAVALGANGSCALLDTGNVACWADSTGFGNYRSTIEVALGSAVELADHGNCVILDTGEVSCWDCQLDEDLGLQCTEPQVVNDLDDAISVSGSCAVRASGAVACWQAEPDGTLSLKRAAD
jgi:hypothetical protein